MTNRSSNNRPIIPVYVFDENGTLLAEYESMTKCSEAEGITCGRISQHCKKYSFDKTRKRYYRRDSDFHAFKPSERVFI